MQGFFFFLVEQYLSMQYCKEILPQGFTFKTFKTLKYIDFTCKNITKLPDLLTPNLETLNLATCKNLIHVVHPSIRRLGKLEIWDLGECQKLCTLPNMLLKVYDEHMLDRLGLGRQNIMTTTNEHLLVKHGVHKTYMNAEDCYSLEPSPALHGQSSLSQPWSQWTQYNESSIGVTFTILNRYLQVISSPLSLSLSL